MLSALFSGPVAYVTGSLALVGLLSGIGNFVQHHMHKSTKAELASSQTLLESERNQVIRCGQDMAALREKVDTSNAQVDAWKAEAAKAAGAQAEATRMARRLAAAAENLGRIAEDSAAFEESIEDLPVCSAYRATLVALAFGGVQ